MVKRQVALYLDVDTVARHQAAGTNISRVCNEFLKTYFPDGEETIQVDPKEEAFKLRSELARLNIQVEADKQKQEANNSKKQKERITVSIIKLRALNAKKQTGSLLAVEEYKLFFNATMIEFGLTRQELAEKVF